MSPEPRPDPEPRGMTLVDLIALVVGFAVVLAVPPQFGVPLGPMMSHRVPAWLLALVVAPLFAAILAFATCWAIVARRLRFGGMPRPAEWLALLVGAMGVVRGLPGVDDLVNPLAHALGRHDWLATRFSLFRWSLAGCGLLIAGASLGWAMAGSKRPGAGLRTLLATIAAGAFLWGPVAVSRIELPGVLGGWTAPWSPVEAEVFRGLGELPGWVLFAVPAVATVRSRRDPHRPAWRWTEWVGAGSGACVMLLAAGLGRFPVGWPALPGLSVGMGLAVLLGWAIVVRLGPAWNRRLGGG